MVSANCFILANCPFLGCSFSTILMSESALR
ncbi:Uncharacterised protein [Segatella copri]|nr:Uncharacterised protein [Segatella copri]